MTSNVCSHTVCIFVYVNVLLSPHCLSPAFVYSMSVCVSGQAYILALLHVHVLVYIHFTSICLLDCGLSEMPLVVFIDHYKAMQLFGWALRELSSILNVWRNVWNKSHISQEKGDLAFSCRLTKSLIQTEDSIILSFLNHKLKKKLQHNEVCLLSTLNTTHQLSTVRWCPSLHIGQIILSMFTQSRSPSQLSLGAKDTPYKVESLWRSWD